MNNFEITLKADHGESAILTTRALLAIAAVASFVYASEKYYYFDIGLGIALVALSVYLKTVLNKFKVSRLLALGVASGITYFTTDSIAFAAVLLVHGFFFEILKKRIWVKIDASEIIIHNIIFNKVHDWASIQNVILKDGILTLDFNNDRLLQSEIVQGKPQIDEKEFNAFCFEQLQKRHTAQAIKEN